MHNIALWNKTQVSFYGFNLMLKEIVFLLTTLIVYKRLREIKLT